MYFFYFIIIPHHKKKGMTLHWTNLNPLHPLMLCSEVWLKLAHWFWRRFFKFLQCIFAILLWSFIWANMNPLHLHVRMCQVWLKLAHWSKEDNEKKKSLQQRPHQQRWTTDKFPWEKFTWAFHSDELKSQFFFMSLMFLKDKVTCTCMLLNMSRRLEIA